jgi:4-diphosphocytidyl-2-C-methyl-D-erythritol kinase
LTPRGEHRKLRMMQTLTAEAPAKLNLTLRVLGTRPDGFHELESLVVRVSLCDTVTVAAHEDGCYSFGCDDPTLPRDGSNLVLQAAKTLNEAAGTNHGAEITLTKRIPAGAGLGGGSSDAATTLKLLNQLWQTGLAAADLARLGAGLGSDVPLFFHTPACVLRGRGEVVDDLADWRPSAWVALILPELQCATPAVYRAWDQLTTQPPRPKLADVLAARGSAAALMDTLFNDLEEPAFAVVPELRALHARVADVTGQAVRLTGSGSAMFRLFDDAPAAARFALRVGTELGVRVDVVSLRSV